MDDSTSKSGDHVVTFGKHKGLSLRQISENFPQYVVWLAGVKTAFSFKTDVIEVYNRLKEEHPKTIEEARAFIHGKCQNCLMSELSQNHKCTKERSTRNYHYHPYGKR